jgi:hypothetical protein
LSVGAHLAGSARTGRKVFWFFFSKKNIFLGALRQRLQNLADPASKGLLFSRREAIHSWSGAKRAALPTPKIMPLVLHADPAWLTLDNHVPA